MLSIIALIGGLAFAVALIKKLSDIEKRLEQLVDSQNSEPNKSADFL